MIPDDVRAPYPPRFPRAAGVLIERPALLRRLDSLAPVTVLQGLPGVGKTSLAAQWAQTRHRLGDRTVWVNAGDGVEPAHLDALRPDRTGQGRTILIIDDAHHCAGDEIADLLCDLLSEFPNLYLLMCTSEAHPAHERARARHLPVNTLTGHDLNATPGQLSDFARAWGHGLDDALGDELFAQLGGWLALTRIALDSRNPATDPAGLLAAGSHVREEILPQAADDTAIAIAMVLSLADGLTESTLHSLLRNHPAMPALLRSRTPDTVMAHLDCHGLIERSGRQGSEITWRFPALIRQVLSETAVLQHPDLAARTHSVLGRTLAEARDPAGIGMAIAHARKAADWDLLSHLWGEHGLRLSLSDTTEALSAYTDMPPRILAASPALALASSVATSLGSGRTSAPADAPHTYADAGWALRSGTGGDDSDTLAVTARCIADRANGLTAEAISTAECHEPRAAASAELTRAWFELHFGLALFSAERGFPAVDMLLRATQTARMAGADVIVSAASAQLALMTATAGHTRDAARYLAVQRGIDTSGHLLHQTITTAGRICAGLLRLDELDPEALACVGRAPAGADATEEWALLAWLRTQHAILFGDPLLMLTDLGRAVSMREGRIDPHGRDRHVADRCAAELLLSLGELNRAERHLADAGERVTTRVPITRLAFLSGDHTRARSLAATAAWDPDMMLRDRADLFMIKAAAALAMGDRDAAVKAFVRGQAITDEIGTLIPYAMLPRMSLQRLLDLTGSPLGEEALTRLTGCRDPYPENGRFVVLSPRELTVLCAMTRHETLADVAAALTVSLNTVKKQSAAIYAKLGVHDRAAALLHARRLGLLPEPDLAGPTGRSDRAPA